MEEKLILTQEWDKTFPKSEKVEHHMLGHYDAGFTLRTYTHATRQAQDEAAEKMGSFMAQMM